MTIWTPGGEHEINRDASQTAAPSDNEPRADQSAPGYDDMAGSQELDEAKQEELAAKLEEVHANVRATPVESMIAQHCIGLIEMAAIYLGGEQPNLPAARLAIDCLESILATANDRMGELYDQLEGMLDNMRMAYVNVSKTVKSGSGAGGGGNGSQPEESEESGA